MRSLPRGGGGEALTIRFGVDLGSGKENDAGQGAQINLHLGGLTVGPELVTLLMFTLFPGGGASREVEETRVSQIGLELTWSVGKRMILVKVLKSICTLVG